VGVKAKTLSSVGSGSRLGRVRRVKANSLSVGDRISWVWLAGLSGLGNRVSRVKLG
jgi:hypothetical protein